MTLLVVSRRASFVEVCEVRESILLRLSLSMASCYLKERERNNVDIYVPLSRLKLRSCSWRCARFGNEWIEGDFCFSIICLFVVGNKQNPVTSQQKNECAPLGKILFIRPAGEALWASLGLVYWTSYFSCLMALSLFLSAWNITFGCQLDLYSWRMTH